VTALRRIGSAYRPRVSENVFYFVLFALGRDYPAPQPTGFVLDGADLRSWTIEEKAGGPRLDLQRTSFRGARLGEAAFRHVDLDDGDFNGADMLRAEVNDGLARRARFDGAALQGTVFRDLDLNGASFAGVSGHRTQFLRCESETLVALDAPPPTFFFAPCRPDFKQPALRHGAARLTVLNGHRDPVRVCAYSADGNRIASGSGDGTLRVWDAASGDCLMTLRGHEGGVNAWPPDGNRILYANADAWRDLAWLIPDAIGALIRYPAETFGPLPRTTA
jgi:hypothetical protein